jgi:polysaccharide biosynthesis/export protein ExoF
LTLLKASQFSDWSELMFTAVKISAMALVAVVALPPYARESTVAPSGPSPVSLDAIVAATAADHSRQAATPLDEGIATPRVDMPQAQAALPARRAMDRSPPAPALPAKLPLAIGDNLKIGFFETIDVGSSGPSGGDGAEPQGALRTFYQRMDLSGEYAIEPDGGISIPLLGRFQVEGRAIDDVRTELATSFNTVIGKDANVDVKILDRSPVYVVGPVKNPGAYKYVPRMIVLQALALAGGLDRGGDNIPGMVEGAREMERLRVETLHVEHLLAQRARLEAERDGLSALSVPAEGVSNLLAPDEGESTLPIRMAKMDLERTAGTFLSRETAILRAEQAKRLQQDQEIALRAAAARSEISELKRKLDQFDVEKGLRNERLDAMQKLKDRGIVTTNNVLLLRTELADIEARRQDSLVTVLQAKARLAEAEGDGAKLTSESTADFEKEIATVDNEIATAREAAISATALATVLYKPGDSTAQATYEIVRQSKDGAKNLQATETSPLMPGDVLKINPNGAASINTNSIRSSTESSLAPPLDSRTANRN